MRTPDGNIMQGFANWMGRPQVMMVLHKFVVVRVLLASNKANDNFFKLQGLISIGFYWDSFISMFPEYVQYYIGYARCYWFVGLEQISPECNATCRFSCGWF